MSQWVKLKAMALLQRHRRAALGQDGAQRAPCLQLFTGEIMNKNNLDDVHNVVAKPNYFVKIRSKKH